MVAPELLVVSDWERHALVADLRGSFTGYGNNFPPPTDGTISSAPVNHRPAGFHRPCRRPARCHAATRGCSARRGCASRPKSRQPEHPGRPAALSGLYDARRHASASSRTSIACSSPPTRTADRTVYQQSQAHRRHLDQQRRPQLQPVWRRRPRQLRSAAGPEAVRRGRGRQPRRTTSSSTAAAMRAIPAAAIFKAGTTFEFARLLTGEISAG